MFRSTAVSCKSPTIRVAPAMRLPLRLPPKNRSVIKSRPSRIIKRSYSTVIVPQNDLCPNEPVGPYDRCGVCQRIVNDLDHERREHYKWKSEYDLLWDHKRKLVRELDETETQNRDLEMEVDRLKTKLKEAERNLDEAKKENLVILTQVEKVMVRVNALDERWGKLSAYCDLGALAKVLHTEEFKQLMKRHSSKV